MHNALGMGPLKQSKSIVETIFDKHQTKINKDKYFLTIPDIAEFNDFKSKDGILILKVPTSQVKLIKFFFRFIYDFIVIPIISHQNKIDKLYCLFNYYPFKFASLKILAIRHDYLINSENITQLSIQDQLIEKLRYFYFKISISTANIVVMQNELTRIAFKKKFTGKNHILFVIPNPVNSIFSDPRKQLTFEKTEKKIIFYPSAYYRHKNHIFLVILAKKYKHFLIENNFYFGLTIDETNVDARELLDKIKDEKLTGVFINFGHLTLIEMKKVYLKCFTVIYPSLVESFGNSLIESLKVGLPIIAIDKPYAKSACDKAALYFDEDNLDKVIEHLSNLLKDKSYYTERIEASIIQAEKYFTFDVWLKQILALST